MPDNLTPAQRSHCMSSVRNSDTDIEQQVRSELHRRGYRFRKHLNHLPGRPDIVFTKARLIVQVDGGFWHGYRFEEWSGELSEFWRDKIGKTIQRDRANDAELRRDGWMVMRLWQQEVEDDFEACIARIEQALEQREPKRA